MSTEHEIEGLMSTTMRSLREMVDVNTIVGDIIESSSGVAVIPVSKVSCGFVAGGGNTGLKDRDRHFSSREREATELPFAGGSGAGININPVAFLVMCGDNVRLIPVTGATNLDKAIEAVPIVTDQLQNLFRRREKDCEMQIPADH
ncbi:MAG: GerW family sporulation protein [Firmicutes bacterium]|nr:GerW family sporulation protein [Bacillota bacterium]